MQLTKQEHLCFYLQLVILEKTKMSLSKESPIVQQRALLIQNINDENFKKYCGNEFLESNKTGVLRESLTINTDRLQYLLNHVLSPYAHI